MHVKYEVGVQWWVVQEVSDEIYTLFIENLELDVSEFFQAKAGHGSPKESTVERDAGKNDEATTTRGRGFVAERARQGVDIGGAPLVVTETYDAFMAVVTDRNHGRVDIVVGRRGSRYS